MLLQEEGFSILNYDVLEIKKFQVKTFRVV